MIRRKIVVLMASCTAAFSSADYAQEMGWYERAPSRCSEPLAANDVLNALGLTGGRVEGTTQGGLYAVIEASDALNDKGAAAPHSLGTVALDEIKARSLRRYLESQSGPDLPLLADVGIASFVGIAIPAGPTFAAQLGYALFRSKIDAISTSIQAEAALVAAGGRLERILAPKLRDHDELYALLVDRYVVSVGNEERSVIIRSCLLPVKLNIHLFRTVGAKNQKEIRSQGAGRWSIFDLEDQKEDSSLFYLGQDRQYFYFKVISGAWSGETYRLGFLDGPMQRLHQDDGTWETIYKDLEIDKK